MNGRQQILTGKTTSLLFKYTTPGILGMAAFSLYILADTFFIAWGVGELGLAALNIGMSLYLK